MKRIKNLNWYQKGIILVMIAMIAIFSILYSVVISKVGFEYMDTILVPSEENGVTLYAGKIKGEKISFTVTEDKSVVFQHGDKIYDTYTVKEDTTAIPKDKEISKSIVGVEICKGDDILFRGGVLETGDDYMFYDEKGDLDFFQSSIIVDTGHGKYENGNLVDTIEPNSYTIFRLVNSPKLTHKGDWFSFLQTVILCVLNIVSILFVDELFRWSMSFQIRDVEDIDPSDWEIMGRYVGWTSITIMVLILFITGLK